MSNLIGFCRSQPVRTGVRRGHEDEDGEWCGGGEVRGGRRLEEGDLLAVASQGHLPVVEVVQGLLSLQLQGHAVCKVLGVLGGTVMV